MVEAIIFVCNFFIIPTIPTLIIYLNNEQKSKFIARFILIYFLNLFLNAILSNIILFLCYYIFNINLSMTSVWYSLIGFIIALIIPVVEKFIKIKIIKKEENKNDKTKEK